jgi:predicted O-methyltransferase YrrM
VTATQVNRFLFPADIDSSLDELEGRMLAALAEGKTVLELGAWLGRSTVCLGQTASIVISCDWHQGDAHAGQIPTLAPYLRNLHRYGLFGRVVPVIGRFDHILPALQDDYFGLIFLDGFHSYEAVRDDTERLLPKLAHGGVLVFHDYGVEASSAGGEPFGVTAALDEMFSGFDVVGTLAIVRP